MLRGLIQVLCREMKKDERRKRGGQTKSKKEEGEMGKKKKGEKKPAQFPDVGVLTDESVWVSYR